MGAWLENHFNVAVEDAMAKAEQHSLDRVDEGMAWLHQNTSPALPAAVRCLVPPLSQASA
jgi:hypothetical protein